MVKVREGGVPGRGTRPCTAPGARGRTTSHHRAPNMVVETRARGRGEDSAPRRAKSAVPPCQSGSGRLARQGGRKQVLGRLIIYIPVERASQIRQLLEGSEGPGSAGCDREMNSVPMSYRATSRKSGPPYVTNPTVNDAERIDSATPEDWLVTLIRAQHPRVSRPKCRSTRWPAEHRQVAGVKDRDPLPSLPTRRGTAAASGCVYGARRTG